MPPVDEPVVAPAAPPAPTPVEPVAPAAPAEPAAPAPAQAEPAPAPAPEPAAPEPAAIKPHTATPSLLSEAGKVVEEPKPGDPPKPEDPNPGEPAKVPEPAAAAPVYEFKMPEGITAEPESLKAYTTLLQEKGLSPEIGQQLLDMHTSTLQKFVSNQLQEQHNAFGKTRAEWVTQAKGDPQLGGSGFKTMLNDVAEMRDRFVPEAHREAFTQFLDSTGAGDHPEFLRLMYNVSRALKEPAPVTAPFRPPADIGKRPGSRREGLYDHPSSARMKG